VKRLLLVALITLVCAACGGGSSSAPTPQPTLAQHPKTQILQPAANARDMVNRLNQQQNREQQQTGGASNP